MDNNNNNNSCLNCEFYVEEVFPPDHEFGFPTKEFVCKQNDKNHLYARDKSKYVCDKFKDKPQPKEKVKKKMWFGYNPERKHGQHYVTNFYYTKEHVESIIKNNNKWIIKEIEVEVEE